MRQSCLLQAANMRSGRIWFCAIFSWQIRCLNELAGAVAPFQHAQPSSKPRRIMLVKDCQVMQSAYTVHEQHMLQTAIVCQGVAREKLLLKSRCRSSPDCG